MPDKKYQRIKVESLEFDASLLQCPCQAQGTGLCQLSDEIDICRYGHHHREVPDNCPLLTTTILRVIDVEHEPDVAPPVEANGQG